MQWSPCSSAHGLAPIARRPAPGRLPIKGRRIWALRPRMGATWGWPSVKAAKGAWPKNEIPLIHTSVVFISFGAYINLTIGDSETKKSRAYFCCSIYLAGDDFFQRGQSPLERIFRFSDNLSLKCRPECWNIIHFWNTVNIYFSTCECPNYIKSILILGAFTRNLWGGGAFDSAKNHKRQRHKRQSVTAKREKSQTPKFV